MMKIEDMIDKIIKYRVDEGQLDECPLTLDELRRIKGAVDSSSGMLPVLRGIYHIRIEYPETSLKSEPRSKPASQPSSSASASAKQASPSGQNGPDK